MDDDDLPPRLLPCRPAPGEHPRRSPETGTIGLVDFGSAGKLTDDDMSKLTRLFIDAANENIDEIPRRLADLGVRYPREREDELRAELRELYYRYYGASLSEIDPIQVIREGVRAHLLAQPAPPDPLPAPRPGDRDARLGRAGALSRTSTSSRSRGRTRAT